MNFIDRFSALKIEMDQLMDQIQGAQVVESQMDRLEFALGDIAQEVEDLHTQMKKEKMDVEKLKGLSLTSFYHTLKNDKTEQVEKEESEVLAVKLKLDRLASQRQAQQLEFEDLKAGYKSPSQLLDQWQQLAETKKLLIKEVKPDVWQQITDKEEAIQGLKLLQKEIDEAVRAGDSAMSQVNKIQKSLDSAAGWGTFDMMGGGLIATMAKRGHLDQAQIEMHEFQNKLKTFNRELKDVGSSVSFEIAIDGFLSFADWFFDGFFVDWAVQSKIQEARDQMATLEVRLSGLVGQLSKENSDNIMEQKQLGGEVAGLVQMA